MSIIKLNPYLIGDMITDIPRDSLYSETWCEIIHECPECMAMKSTYKPFDELDKEMVELYKYLSDMRSQEH
ncbi:MAG: hypothetical protein WBQ25_26325 [Nitrososphaeraceae archaeon]